LPDPKDSRSVQAGAAGAHSLAEILSQPECWSACLGKISETEMLEEVCGLFAGVKEWLFLGCGSSYYVALSAAATMRSLTGLRASAVPASELLIYPERTLARDIDCSAVFISRSGRTSEMIKAAELLRARGIATLAVTCASGQPLEQLASTTIVLTPADEKSTVMTRSFTSMLLALQDLAAAVAGNNVFSECLRKLPASVTATLKTLPARIHQFVSSRQFTDYVCLGQGPFYGLACECALKVTEMSVSCAQAFHTLEFRHGPKSLVSPETLLVFLLSESGYWAECELLEEVKSLGGTTLVITNKPEARVRAASDLLIDFSQDLPELARIAPYVFAGQLLGLYTGLAKGLDPDRPRNLSRVVVLDAEEFSQNP
jgi:glucosamine--fructose-6-phosphate aminotransferase (isomerizing)